MRIGAGRSIVVRVCKGTSEAVGAKVWWSSKAIPGEHKHETSDDAAIPLR